LVFYTISVLAVLTVALLAVVLQPLLVRYALLPMWFVWTTLVAHHSNPQGIENKKGHFGALFLWPAESMEGILLILNTI
jgi:hypothetical protein